MKSLLMVFNQVVDLSQSEYYFTWLIEKYRVKRPQRHVAKKKNPELHKLIRELEKKYRTKQSPPRSFNKCGAYTSSTWLNRI